MAYADDETSVEESRPVELYDLELPTITYRLTSYDEDYTYSGNTYSATPVSRGDVTEGAIGRARETMVSLPIDHAAAQALLASGIPPRTARLTITRLQQRSGETRRVWRGPIVSWTVDEPHLRLRVPDATDQALAITLPFAVIAKTCNHALYDNPGCTVARASFKLTPTVAAVSGVSLTISSISGKPDQWAKFGEVVRVTDGERRSILSQVGTALTLDEAFGTLNNGDSLEVYAGCDHTVATCRDKFSNVANFGGHPDLPVANPFSQVALGTRIKT